MKLTFKSRHKSLRELPETDLPPFVLITGVNGAGKTHLLQAIQSGAVVADIAPDCKNDVRYFDWTTLMPSDAAQTSTNALYSERDQIVEQVRGIRSQFDARLNLVLGSSALKTWNFDGWELASLPPEEFMNVVKDRAVGPQLFAQVQSIVTEASALISQQIPPNHPLGFRLLEVAAASQCPVSLLGLHHFRGRHFGWGSVDLFQQSFAQLFLAYFELQKLNRLYRMEEQEGRVPSEASLTEESFIGKNGEPPWNFVNRTLQEARLDFEIDHPVGWETTTYLPKLRKTSSGANVLFSALSSGEKVLMSFALCLYNSSYKKTTGRAPEAAPLG